MPEFFLFVFYNRNRNLGSDMKRQKNNIVPTIKVSVSGLSRRANEDVNSATRFKVAVSGEVKKLSREF